MTAHFFWSHEQLSGLANTSISPLSNPKPSDQDGCGFDPQETPSWCNNKVCLTKFRTETPHFISGRVWVQTTLDTFSVGRVKQILLNLGPNTQPSHHEVCPYCWFTLLAARLALPLCRMITTYHFMVTAFSCHTFQIFLQAASLPSWKEFNCLRSAAVLGKAVRLLIYWQDPVCCLVIPLQQVAVVLCTNIIIKVAI